MRPGHPKAMILDSFLEAGMQALAHAADAFLGDGK
jgi:hypothetical protein